MSVPLYKRTNATLSLTWMAFSRPRVPPCGLLKKDFHWFMDCRLFIKLPSKPFVEDVMSLDGTAVNSQAIVGDCGELTEERAMR